MAGLFRALLAPCLPVPVPPKKEKDDPFDTMPVYDEAP